jgi:two-component system, chemotaxis family, chemotaxis protein CheY
MAKIVICDDSKSALAFFDRRLREAGHEIVGKGQDGDEGFRVFMETKPDLILLDVTMPNKDGRECLEMILKQDPSAKVIMVSAVKDNAVIQECLRSGAKSFVSKTNIYEQEEFKKEVLNVIDQVLKS